MLQIKRCLAAADNIAKKTDKITQALMHFERHCVPTIVMFYPVFELLCFWTLVDGWLSVLVKAENNRKEKFCFVLKVNIEASEQEFAKGQTIEGCNAYQLTPFERE